MAEIEHPPIPLARPLDGPLPLPRSQTNTGRNTPIVGGRNVDDAIIIGSSDDEDEPPIVPRRLGPRSSIIEQRARLRNNRNGTPIARENGLRIMSPPPPVPQIQPFMLHEPGPMQERRRNHLMGTLPLAPGPQDGYLHNLQGYLRAERLQLLNLLHNPHYPASFMDIVGMRERQPVGPPPPPPEYDTRMTHASVKPRIGYTFDFEIEPEPVESAVRTRTTIIIPDSPPTRPIDYKGKGKAKEEDFEDELELNGDPNAPIELISSPAAGSSSSSSRPKKKQQQRRAVEIVEVLSDDETDDESSSGSPSNSQPTAFQGLQNVLVCASCRRPLRTGGDRLWALRCGHMIDSRCYHKFSEQPDEQGSLAFDSTSTVPPRPSRPSKRRKTGRASASKPTTPQVLQTYQWQCPATGCTRTHTSERVLMNGETSWRPAQADGAIKVFI